MEGFTYPIGSIVRLRQDPKEWPRVVVSHRCIEKLEGIDRAYGLRLFYGDASQLSSDIEYFNAVELKENN